MTIRTLGSRYLLEERIGQGGMGVVWRGRDKGTGAQYAIKVLRPEYSADPEAVTRFVRERTVLMRFRHPAVVTVHDMIVEGDQLALVMDLVTGGDLTRHQRRHGGTLPPDEVARISAQICDGLDAAHLSGIVHRDLKPANVLLDDGRVQLADFGVARIVGDPSATASGIVLGTAAYLAPEMLTGSEPSPACDMYALGITMYEMLAGRPPFTGHVAAVMHDHLDTAPSRIPGVPDRLWDLVSSCLAKTPPGRPDAATLAAALREPVLVSSLAAVPVAPAVPSGPMVPSGPAGPAAPVVPAGLAGPFGPTGPAGPSASPARTPPGIAAPVTSPQPGATRTGPVSVNGFVPLSAPVPASVLADGPGGPSGPGGPGGPGWLDRWRAGFSGWRGGRGIRRFAGPRVLAAVGAGVAVLTCAIIVALVAGSGAPGHLARSAASAGADVPTAAPGSVAGAPTAGPHPTPEHHRHHQPKPSQSGHQALPTVVPTPTHTTKPSPRPGGGTLVPYGPNLVIDGDFADGTLGPWTTSVNAAVEPGYGPSGLNAARLTASPTAGIIEVITGLKPGASYEVTGWGQAQGAKLFIGASDDNDDLTDIVGITFTSAAWRHGSAIFTLGKNQTSAKVFCVQQGGAIGYCTGIAFRAMHRSR